MTQRTIVLRDLPKPAWKQVLVRMKDMLFDDRLEVVAAGMAFQVLFALAPALAAVVAIYGFFARPEDISVLLTRVFQLAPSAGRDIAALLLGRAVDEAPGVLTLRALAGLFLTVWSANRGTKALLAGINMAYGLPGRQGFVRENLVSLGFMLAAMLGFVIAASAVLALPHLLGSGLIGSRIALTISVLRWPLLFALFWLPIAALYRWGPARTPPRWRWVSPGSVLATLAWLLASYLLSLYSTHASKFDSGYILVDGFVALVVWLYVSAFVILLGAELDAELERQAGSAAQDGDPEPLG